MRKCVIFDSTEEIHQICYKVYLISFLARPSGKTCVFCGKLDTVSSIDHVVRGNHIIDWDNTKILDKEEHKKTRCIREAL